jgi:hypothetical protein
MARDAMANNGGTHDALTRIAELALAELGRTPNRRGGTGSSSGIGSSGRGSGNGHNGSSGGGRRPGAEFIGCQIKPLPHRLTEQAAQVATKINPVNAPMRQPVRGLAAAMVPDPLSIAVLTSRYWGAQRRELTVSFMDQPETALRRRILEHMNAWSTVCGVSFVETNGVGQIRIARERQGYYSYLGTDINLIPPNRQTMNLQEFSMDTPESEFHRVVRHETGHTLGFPHEHMRTEIVNRIDPEKAYAYFQRTQGWDRKMVDQQVLTPLDEADLMGTPVEEESIMCYQLDGSITVDGEPIVGGTDITLTDYAFAAAIYPKFGFAPGGSGGSGSAFEDELDWDRADDVLTPV